VPTVAAGNAVVVIVGGTTIVQFHTKLVVGATPFQQPNVTLPDVTVPFGVPLITPVEPLSERPLGKVPDIIVKFSGRLPVPVSAALYDLPNTGCGSTVVGILGATPGLTITQFQA
jgi:hypothetical protein